jgi:hypothetical protein
MTHKAFLLHIRKYKCLVHYLKKRCEVRRRKGKGGGGRKNVMERVMNSRDKGFD